MAPTTTRPVVTSAYNAFLDAATANPTDLPATIEAAARVLRTLVADLGSWARAWTYQPRENWPHAGWVRTDDTHPFGVLADVHAATNAGPLIAVMSPPLALAVADWLTAAAAREREYQTNPPHLTRGAGRPEPADEAFAALVVAHTILAAARSQAVAR